MTLQRVENGALVYSLVTKKDYFGKTTEEDYTTVFTQLTQYFKKRGQDPNMLSHGHIHGRDLIQPEHFIKKIVELQQKTNAIVYIVSHD